MYVALLLAFLTMFSCLSIISVPWSIIVLFSMWMCELLIHIIQLHIMWRSHTIPLWLFLLYCMSRFNIPGQQQLMCWLYNQLPCMFIRYHLHNMLIGLSSRKQSMCNWMLRFHNPHDLHYQYISMWELYISMCYMHNINIVLLDLYWRSFSSWKHLCV